MSPKRKINKKKMDKFTKLDKNDFQPKKKKEDILFENEWMKIINYEDYTTILQSDCVFCAPVLIEKNQLVIRKEYIPSFKYKTGQEYHLSFVGGGIEIGETPEQALLRELQEEAGLILRDNYKVEIMKPLFLSKAGAAQCYLSILYLTENDYEETRPTTDGTKFEKMSHTAKVDIKYLDSLLTSDLVTEFLLMKLKQEMNL